MQGFSHSTPQSREQRGPGITRVLGEGGWARQRRLGHDKEDSSTVTLQSAPVGMWASATDTGVCCVQHWGYQP